MVAISELIGFVPTPAAEITPEVNDHGLVQAVWIRDGNQRARATGDALRLQVGRSLGWNLIFSNAYMIETRGDWLIFQGRGFGHNIGLCLSGAVAQARRGRAYKDILRYYFPGSTLEKRTTDDRPRTIVHRPKRPKTQDLTLE
jgi:stage II sporulation protein D